MRDPLSQLSARGAGAVVEGLLNQQGTEVNIRGLRSRSVLTAANCFD